MKHCCAVANQKGGVGKTTTVQNLSVGLARQHRQRVLMVDLDAQGNLTDAVGVDEGKINCTAYDVMEGKVPLAQATIQLEENLYILPAGIELSEADIAFAGRMGRENLLKKALQSADYDLIFIDCPPSLGLLTVNALAAADSILIPVQGEYHALSGLKLMQNTLHQVQEHLNPTLRIFGVLLTLYDKRLKLHRDVEEELREAWKDRVFATRIRDNIALAEAPSADKDIYTYRQKSFGAEDYSQLSIEFLARLARIHPPLA